MQARFSTSLCNGETDAPNQRAPHAPHRRA
jgi:hypothetical protein